MVSSFRPCKKLIIKNVLSDPVCRGNHGEQRRTREDIGKPKIPGKTREDQGEPEGTGETDGEPEGNQ